MRYLDIIFNVQVDGIIYGMFFVVHSRRFVYLRGFGVGDRMSGE
jgi:hypothetical protein